MKMLKVSVQLKAFLPGLKTCERTNCKYRFWVLIYCKYIYTRKLSAGQHKMCFFPGSLGSYGEAVSRFRIPGFQFLAGGLRLKEKSFNPRQPKPEARN